MQCHLQKKITKYLYITVKIRIYVFYNNSHTTALTITVILSVILLTMHLNMTTFTLNICFKLFLLLFSLSDTYLFSGTVYQLLHNLIHCE